MVIEGKNPVHEALKSDATAEKLYVQKGANEGVIAKIVTLAKTKNVPITFVDKLVLERLSPQGKHQGVVLFQTEYKYYTLEDVLDYAASKNQAPFVLVLDGITDPHNLGSIIRTAECAGAHGIIIGKHRSVTVNDTVMKCSAGAAEHMRIVRATNINDEIKKLKQQNIYVYVADMDGEHMYSANLKGAIALIIGSEGEGVKRLTKELADGVISIPMMGKINSLNASVAAAVAIYEKVRQDKD